MDKVRCNNCMEVFDERELIYDENEDMEFCPYCGKGGCIMDLGEEELEMKLTDAEIEKLWDELEDVPIDEDEYLDIDWKVWSKGTHREEIWHWFDENHSKGVGWLMNERETKY